MSKRVVGQPISLQNSKVKAVLATTLLFGALSPDADHLKVVGGETSPTGVWPATVAIGVNNTLCTGSLLTSTLVITAAHCLKDVPAQDSPVVYVGQNLGDELVSIQHVAKWETHPKYCDSKTCKIPEFDFAYIKLESPVNLKKPDDYAKLLVTPEDWSHAIRPEAPVWLVGFGNSDQGEAGQKHHVQTSITRVLDSGAGFFAGQQGKDSCTGDSGGPAYVRLDNKRWAVAGLLSAGSDPCGQGGYFASAVDIVPWLKANAGYQVSTPCEDSSCLRSEASKVDAKGGCSVFGTSPTQSSMMLWLLVAGLALSRTRASSRSSSILDANTNLSL